MPAARTTITATDLGSLFFNFISAPPDCLDIVRMFKGIPHFFPQMADMNRDRIVAFAEVFFTPYFMEQFFGAYDRAFPAAENT